MARAGLNAAEVRFVANMLHGMAKGAAAEAAGYSARSAPGTASRLLNRAPVLKALREGAERALNAGLAVGARVLLELAENSKSDDVRLRAAQALLDRGGLPLTRLTETRHVLVDERSDAELRARLAELEREEGRGRIIDVESHPVALPVLAAPDDLDPFED
jgi:hypothetical protein